MAARIFKPARSAMQSGQGRTKEWVLAYEPQSRQAIEPLMGWTSSADMLAEVKLEFDTKGEAIAYAEANGLAWTLIEPKPRSHIKKSYSDNFRYGRIGRWTH